MSKSEKLRELQAEINRLKFELENKDKQLKDYQIRDRPRAGDFIRGRERGELYCKCCGSPTGNAGKMFFGDPAICSQCRAKQSIMH